jgi:topoisomerase-4 subunit A
MIAGDPANPQDRFLLTTTGGTGFICAIADLVTRLRAGKDFQRIEPDTHSLRPLRLPPETRQPLRVAAMSSDNRLLVFPLEEVVTRAGGGLGVQIMALPDGIRMADIRLITDSQAIPVRGEKKGSRLTGTIPASMLDLAAGKRAQRGRLVDLKMDNLTFEQD